MEGVGAVIGKKAPEFTLLNQDGETIRLSEVVKKTPVMLVFYPGDFTLVCTKQLCNYRDNFDAFQKLGVQILGVSKNSVEKHKEFANTYSFPFSLLYDPENMVAKKFGCSSKLMLGNTSRAVFIINTGGLVLYRYVEPTPLTRRKADELVGILEDLKTHSLI